MFFRKKEKYPEIAKYKKGDLVNFRYKGELYFGYINNAHVNDDNITYIIQIGGECPTLIYHNKEEDVLGLVKPYKR